MKTLELILGEERGLKIKGLKDLPWTSIGSIALASFTLPQISLLNLGCRNRCQSQNPKYLHEHVYAQIVLDFFVI